MADKIPNPYSEYYLRYCATCTDKGGCNVGRDEIRECGRMRLIMVKLL